MRHTYRSQIWVVILFDSCYDDVVTAATGVQHTSLKSVAQIFSPSLPNHCFWDDKFWGPSQRVVTLFSNVAVVWVVLASY